MQINISARSTESLAVHSSPCAGLLLAVLLLALAPRATAADANRFVGALADGRQIEGKQIFDWYNNDVRPRLDSQALFDDNNPVMWLRDREARRGDPPSAFVETVCGDRLPGTVREYLHGSERANLTLRPHVVVEPAFEQDPAYDDPNLTVRVAVESIRRIVWQRRLRDTYEPNHLFLRDGGAVRFRAARFGSSFVSLLTDAGPQRHAFGEIAELHLPLRDAWEAHLNELAALATDVKSRIMQIETSDGLIATASLSRLVVLGHGGPDRYDLWIHAVQPAWSLDPLWVPCRNVAVRRFFAMNEVPLYRLPAARVTHGSAFGAERSLNRKTNVLGGLLRSGQQEGGWGFGVQGGGEVAFGLHRAVRQLRGRVGLDQAVGGGGCIRARVIVGKNSNSHVWESPFIVGSQQVISLGTVGIDPGPANEEVRELRLVIDPAHEGRPAGSDPWAIRDLADWMDPLLVLDENLLREELRRRLPGRIPAWTGWQVVLDEPDSLSAVSAWSAIDPRVGEHRTLTLTKGEQSVRLLCTIPMTDESNWLIVLPVHRTPTGQPAEIEVRIGGELAGKYKTPLLDPSHRDPDPLIIPLANYRKNGARQLDVEIIRHHSDTPLDWRAIAVVKHMPLLATLFEDHGEFQPQADDPLPAELVKGNRHSGEASIRVPGGQKVTLRFDHPLEVRSNPAWGQYRFLRFAFRKKGGRIGIELERPPGEEQAVRFDAGQGEPVEGEAKRVWGNELPDEWIVSTRDLVSEFGEFNAEAVTLIVPDGEQALFDHIYLARNERDFALAAPALSPELTNEKAYRELAAEIRKRALAAVVKLKMSDGRTGTGTLIDAEGHIVTAGHLLVAAGQEVEVSLSDGRQLKGKSLGIDRESDLGLVKLDEKGPYPQLDVENNEGLDSKPLYLGAVYLPAAPANEEPLTQVVGIRRVLDGLIWTDFDAAEWTAGGPLLNRDARIVGVLVSRSRFGGFQYLTGARVRQSLDRMKRSEVWGQWQSGSGPMVGLVIRTVSQGCRVIEVLPDSPAAAAGLQVDDYVTQIDGQPVESLSAIYDLLKSKNPGDKVKVGYIRATGSHQTEMTLTPRWP